ncbi:uncharacterized protein PGTG_00706 [Puccinia graminis f. sp. tritici CRL 75-36-700-3]|uniref:Uncharacterized protein n=1 Tax=Puccinia graminis f. sp. tritici (strain CRL 75-36-700-3 / race SCCL) TaxID=418459 RepID=E3JRF5_PUCGT|nr:uncharacterized protein PGTG_00706 [Puccinia graminis f. sp. tritici CRL 75-36-700-3]EFP74750.1 hypothetical protein PGTG_00706 [Puccinia graminis f. sp. tritici CRL 75-36-700-3]
MSLRDVIEDLINPGSSRKLCLVTHIVLEPVDALWKAKAKKGFDPNCTDTIKLKSELQTGQGKVMKGFWVDLVLGRQKELRGAGIVGLIIHKIMLAKSIMVVGFCWEISSNLLEIHVLRELRKGIAGARAEVWRRRFETGVGHIESALWALSSSGESSTSWPKEENNWTEFLEYWSTTCLIGLLVSHGIVVLSGSLNNFPSLVTAPMDSS